MRHPTFSFVAILTAGIGTLASCTTSRAVGGASATTLPAAPIARVGVAVGSGDWPSYNRTLAGDRFSPLAEVNRTNVAQMKSICSYSLPEVTSLQTGLIVVDGTMFFTTDTVSYALDASTCAEKWKKVRHSPTPSGLGVNRGFAYMDGRLFRGTSDAHVLAMDPTDGHTIWDYEIDAKAPGATIPMSPIASDGVVYIGNAGGDQVGVKGHVYALDARDGHVVWRFDVIPDSGPARATWTNAATLPITGGAFWTSFTFDEASRVLYVPAGNPAPDFDIETRAGDNLYTNSVIALDASSGRMLGYNQLVKHDIHDWDVDSPPTLLTTKSGRSIVASANKDGLLSVLDRGRLTSAGVRAAVGDPASALPLLYQVPTTTRLNVTTPMSRDQAVRFCPGITGGSEWNGAAYHPQLNTLYVGAVDWCAKVQLNARGTPPPPAGQAWFNAANSKDMFDPPDSARGWVTAFDAENGTVRWKFASPRPVLAAITPTAGGLVFSADLGGQLRAFDAETGKVLWETNTGQSTGGGLITYVAGGRQLVAVASGMKSPVWPGGAQQSRILIFGLR